MKKKIVTLVLMIIFLNVFSQVKGTSDVFSLKIGLIGGWIGYEKSISNKWTINTEIGYEGGFLKATKNNNVDYIFSVIGSVEPRYYHNLTKRVKKSKNVNNNAANYISAELFFVPNILTITNRDNISYNKSFGIIPKYGIRRNISKRMSFEFALGLGYAWRDDGDSRVSGGLDLKFAYSF